MPEPLEMPKASNGGDAVQRRRPHPHDPNRFMDGTVAPRNSLALTHGGRRRHDVILAEERALLTAWAADMGGLDELSVAQRELLERAVVEAGLARGCDAYLRRFRGSLTSRKAQAAIATMHAATDRLIGLTRLLGLERKARSLASMSATEYLEAQRAQEGTTT